MHEPGKGPECIANVWSLHQSTLNQYVHLVQSLILTNVQCGGGSFLHGE